MRKASASQGALSRSKKKAWCSSSGRTYWACSRGGRHGDLADEQPLVAVAGGVLLAHRPPVAPHVVHLGLVPGERVDRVAGAGVGLGVGRVGQLGVLEEAGGDIDAEAVDAPVEPEAQGVVEVRRRPRGCASSGRAARA